jgi:hypothetical protein
MHCAVDRHDTARIEARHDTYRAGGDLVDVPVTHDANADDKSLQPWPPDQGCTRCVRGMRTGATRGKCGV